MIIVQNMPRGKIVNLGDIVKKTIGRIIEERTEGGRPLQDKSNRKPGRAEYVESAANWALAREMLLPFCVDNSCL